MAPFLFRGLPSVQAGSPREPQDWQGHGRPVAIETCAPQATEKDGFPERGCAVALGLADDREACSERNSACIVDQKSQLAPGIGLASEMCR
jgi:hypothetical protein